VPDSPGQPRDVLFIQFAKSPLPGRVKTRMQPCLSAEQACALHTELLLWTWRTLHDAALADLELWVSGDTGHPVFKQCRSLEAGAVRLQQGADLGERMYHAIADGLGRYRKVILVGSDCPEIDTAYLKAAVQALDTQPLVLGPATDGGYVLIGATRIQAALFAGVSWGEGSVFTQTQQRINELGESYFELRPLSDIDRPGDLPAWESLREEPG